MERTKDSLSTCSIARTLAVVGEKWTLLVIRECFWGATRFEQFQRALGCPRTVLTERLRGLVDEGVLERRAYREEGRRARQEYLLTDKGRDLGPVFLALMTWGDRHEAGPAGPAVVARHAGCGGDLRISFTCSCGHADVEPHAVELVAGPGAVTTVAAPTVTA